MIEQEGLWAGQSHAENGEEDAEEKELLASGRREEKGGGDGAFRWRAGGRNGEKGEGLASGGGGSPDLQ